MGCTLDARAARGRHRRRGGQPPREAPRARRDVRRDAVEGSGDRARARAETKLATTLVLIDAGVSQPEPDPEPEADSDATETFHVFASRWLQDRKGELDDNTYKDDRWRLVNHQLPFFAERPVAELDVKAVDDYRIAKVAERDRVQEAIAIGVDVRDHDGRKIRPLSNESINKTLMLLAAVLDVAVDHGLLVSNPARGKRRRLKVTGPHRPLPESDEIRSLLGAAEDLDCERYRASEKALEVRRLRDE